MCIRDRLETGLRDLPGNAAPLAAIAPLKQRLGDAAVPELAAEGLHEFIDNLQIGFGDLHDQIAAAYFA